MSRLKFSVRAQASSMCIFEFKSFLLHGKVICLSDLFPKPEVHDGKKLRQIYSGQLHQVRHSSRENENKSS